MKEMFTFSCYNHLSSLIMMNAYWKLWWLLSHAELTTHHACVAHRAATKSFQPCLPLASFSMVLQL